MNNTDGPSSAHLSRRAVLGFGAAAAAVAVTGLGSAAQAAGSTAAAAPPECLADLVGGNHG